MKQKKFNLNDLFIALIHICQSYCLYIFKVASFTNACTCNALKWKMKIKNKETKIKYEK